MTFAESEAGSAPGRARLESTQVSSSFEGGGRDAAPAGELSDSWLGARPQPSSFARLRARYRESVWAPVLAKLAGVGFGMLALSGIGAVSIARSGQGLDLSDAERLHKDIAGVWLAASPSAPAAAASAPAATPAPSTSTSPPELATASARAAADDRGGDAGSEGGDKPKSGLTADGKVILNLATAQELTRLPGVGAKRAERIIELRNKLGRFRKITDLLRVRGIGAKSLRKMLPHLVLDPPAGPS